MSRTLTVYLAADLKRFSPQLRDAENDLGRFGRGVDGLSNNLTRMLGPALIGAAAAAGIAAVAFGVDGVKAFVEDEAAAAKLAQTMKNLGMEDATAAVEANIDAMQRQTGVADSQLRPSMSRLLTSTNDVTLATDTMKLALDVSAGTGRSLESVVNSLAKGFDGSTTSLGKLGAGLDKATLATGDMRVITEELARTFSGQAETAANTYQGQLDRLAVGFDELKESFGAGFLTSLDDTTQGTNDLMDAMKDLEPAMRDLGATASKAAIGLAKFAAEAANVVDGAVAMADQPSWDGLISHLRNTFEATDQFKGAIGGIPGVGRFLEDLYDIAAGFIALDDAQGNGFVDIGGGEFPNVDKAGKAWAIYNEAKRDSITAARLNGQALADEDKNLNRYTSSSSSATNESDLLTAAFEAQSEVINDLNDKLAVQVQDLDDATQKAKDYAATLAASLLGGIDLGAAQQTGTDLGISTLDAFDRQIEQSNWFGNVLENIQGQLNAEDADRLVTQLAALGPEAGGKLGQEMIDKGLVQAFADRLEDVQATATTTAQAMVPSFLEAGIDAAEGMVDQTELQIAKENKRLKSIGDSMGKTIGLKMKQEIAEAIAEAVRAAEVAKTSAAAERAAIEAAREVRVNEQQIAQAVQRMITNSNARAGSTTGAPAVSPVLG